MNVPYKKNWGWAFQDRVVLPSRSHSKRSASRGGGMYGILGVQGGT